MTCHDVQLQLSLYLYGELDFATEEAVERHLATCAFCQQALVREKTWHSAASSEHRDVPLDLLSQCRQDLRRAVTNGVELRKSPGRTWRHFLSGLRITPTRWSYQLAMASFLVFVGFTGGRLFNRISPSTGLDINAAGLLSPTTSRIRDIQSSGSGRVRIVLDQVNQREIVGSPNDQNVRQWLLVASQDPSDPGIRVDSVEVLGSQTGSDVRDALLKRIEHDPNAAVRLKALEAVRSFASDPATRAVLRSALEHDSDPAVRSEAIDILAPANEKLQLSPELAGTLEILARSDHDDYVRGRCLQVLHAINDPIDVY
ncbi:MAG TPA: HEAT repeat domain-containing protein [Bryobacteraceae bacterium]|jgi:hypothetical protein|nr:HEAT repeat domain-containing protein [Bryobacteraceae bacterium]